MFVNRTVDFSAKKLDDSQYSEGIRNLIVRMDEAGSSALLTGSVQLVGLAEIRQKFGSGWDSVGSQASRIAEEEIGARLGGTDIYKPDDEGYLICFDSVDEAGAKQLAQEISRAIEDRLISLLAGVGGDLSVDSFVASVPTASFRSAPDPTYALKAALTQIRIEVESAAKERPFGHILAKANVVFQPIWSSQAHGKTQNRSILDPLSGTAVAKYIEEIDDRDELIEALANLDCVVLTRSVEGLHQALKVMKRASIAVPVHYHTLTSDFSVDLVSLGASVPTQYRKFLLIDVIGTPASAGSKELIRAAKTALQVADRIIFQVMPNDSRVNEAFIELLWGISNNIAEINTEDPVVQRELVRFAAFAAESGLQSFAYGANTLGKAMAAVRASFDFVAGSAVHNTVPAPRPQTRFSPLFGDPIAKMRKTDQGAALRTHARFTPINPHSVLTLADGRRSACRVVDVSASGAAVLSNAPVEIGTLVALGSLPGRVVRVLKNGFAVQFNEIQQASLVEAGLVAPLADHTEVQGP